MTEEEATQNGEAAAAAEPEKKKRSVKVVKRVKSKKSEKSGVPDLAPPPAAAAEQVEPEDKENAGSAAPSRNSSIASTKRPVVAAAEEARPPTRVPSTSSRRRAQRSGSNVFAMFTQNQVAQFKEAFGFIDQDKDGIISRSDIRATFDALGRLCSDKELDEMTREAPGPINFTMFLTVFGDRIQGTDEEDVVTKAFASFDEGDGFVKEDKLRHVLMTWGEKFTPQECDVILAEAPRDSRNRIDVRRFATLVTRGNEDEEEQAD